MGLKASDLDALRANLARNPAKHPSTSSPKPPPKGLLIPTEAEEMERLCLWMHSVPIFRGCFLHVPNERVNKIERFKLSRQGVAPGAPDLLIIARPPDGACGAAVELKRSDRKSPKDPEHGASDAQRVWLMTLRVAGWHARVCYGADEAIAFLASIYRLESLAR